MARTEEHNNLSPAEKQSVFREAYGRIKSYRSEQNFIAAHTLAAALLEDRVMSSYFLHLKSIGHTEFNEKKINRTPISVIARRIRAVGMIDEDTFDQLNDCFQERNQLVHQMIWRAREFNDESVERVLNVSRLVDNALRRYARAMTKQVTQSTDKSSNGETGIS